MTESFERSDEDRSQTGLTIYKACSMASKFCYFKAQFVPRACNQVTDKLARLAPLTRLAGVMNDQVWYNEVPASVKNVISLDSYC